MGRVKIICSGEGNDLAHQIKLSLDKVASKVTIINVKELSDDCVVDNFEIKAIVLTEDTCEQLQRVRGDRWIEWFPCPGRTIVIHRDEDLSRRLDNHLSSITENWMNERKTFDVSERREWFYAEAEMKALVEEAKQQQLLERRFFFKPETVSSASDADVAIILLDKPDDVGADPDILQVIAGENLQWNAEKIQKGVWTFSPTDLAPGCHEIYLQGDEQHLGSATLTVLNDEEVAISTLAKAMETKPLLMLSKLLRIDNRKPDSELLSYLRDSKEVLLQLLRLGDPEGLRYPDLRSFCKNHGLKRCDKALSLKLRLSSDSEDEITPKLSSPLGNGSALNRVSVESGYSDSMNARNSDAVYVNTKEQMAKLSTGSLPTTRSGSFDRYLNRPPQPLPGQRHSSLSCIPQDQIYSKRRQHEYTKIFGESDSDSDDVSTSTTKNTLETTDWLSKSMESGNQAETFRRQSGYRQRRFSDVQHDKDFSQNRTSNRPAPCFQKDISSTEKQGNPATPNVVVSVKL